MQGRRRHVKNRITTIILVVFLILGLGILSYPMVSNILRDRKQDQILTEYNEELENMPDEEIEEARRQAQAYNDSLAATVVISDPFDPDNAKELGADYVQVLNLEENGIMAYVEIPRIEVYEPVYHGTSDDVLAKGVGHLEATSLPIGGTGTHAVLSGHTGLPDAEIFTKLDSLQEGDLFLIHVLKETLAYEVDQIKVVEPSDTSDLHIDPEQDYVTLVTCTPYGINSHRLLVRGARVPYTPELEEEAERQKQEGSEDGSWKSVYGKSIIEGIILAAALIILIVLIDRRKRRRPENEKRNEKGNDKRKKKRRKRKR